VSFYDPHPEEHIVSFDKQLYQVDRFLHAVSEHFGVKYENRD
jgi:hypothetical protein